MQRTTPNYKFRTFKKLSWLIVDRPRTQKPRDRPFSDSVQYWLPYAFSKCEAYLLVHVEARHGPMSEFDAPISLAGTTVH